ncbi:MAG: putative glycoside hydrolase [Clostridia bacterium]
MYPNNYRRYAKMKKRMAIKNALFFILLFVLGSAVAFLFIQKSHSNDDTNNSLEDLDTEHMYDNSDDVLDIVVTDRNLQALYVDITKVNDKTYADEILLMASENEINSFVVTMKNADGSFNYQSEIPYNNLLVSENNVTDFITRATDWGITLIAEIYVYSDDNHASLYETSAFENTDGSNWLDYNESAWINPYSDDGFNYITAIIDELTSLGFSEIILSDFHFPVFGDFMSIVYGSEVSKTDILAERLKTLSENYKISLNLSQFAFTDNHVVSGEDVEKLAKNVFSVFVNVTSDTTYNNYKYLNVENKVIFTTIDEYLVDNFIRQ